MSSEAKRGRPPKPDAKVAVTLRLPPDVLAAYQAKGEDWRAEMVAALWHAFAATEREIAENVVKKALKPHIGKPVTPETKAAVVSALTELASAPRPIHVSVPLASNEPAAPGSRLKKR